MVYDATYPAIIESAFPKETGMTSMEKSKSTYLW